MVARQGQQQPAPGSSNRRGGADLAETLNAPAPSTDGAAAGGSHLGVQLGRRGHLVHVAGAAGVGRGHGAGDLVRTHAQADCAGVAEVELIIAPHLAIIVGRDVLPRLQPQLVSNLGRRELQQRRAARAAIGQLHRCGRCGSGRPQQLSQPTKFGPRAWGARPQQQRVAVLVPAARWSAGEQTGLAG